MIKIRRMTIDDLGLGIRLSAEAGWNQTGADWRRFIELEPQGCFVGELNGRSVGTTTTCVFRKTAWIAMVLVDMSARHKGVGTTLLKHSIEYLQSRRVKTIRLDATSFGQPIYEKLGFEVDYELARFEGVAPASKECSAAVEATPAMSGDLLEFDKRMTGLERGTLLSRLFEEFPENLRVVKRSGEIEGFVTMRPGANAVRIGPCTATPDVGPALLSDALNSCTGEPVLIDVPSDNVEAVKVAKSGSLTIKHTLTRMSRGPKIKDNVQASWASSGAEKG
ncbi:MAG: GNAT family N-acetyltransferase [Planctomycetota bacterium]|jgi:GNAT superfamily N-acetyltransferase